IVFFECLPEDDGVDGGQSQVAEETRLGTDVIGIFAAIEIPQDAGHVVQDLLFRPRHVRFLSPRRMSAKSWPSWRSSIRCTSRSNEATAADVPGTLVNATRGSSSIRAAPRYRARQRPSSPPTSSMSAGKRRCPWRENH